MTNLQKKSIRNKLIGLAIFTILGQGIILVGFFPKSKILEIEGYILAVLFGLFSITVILWAIFNAIMESIKDFKIRGFLTEKEYDIFNRTYFLSDEEEQEQEKIVKLVNDTLGKKWEKY